MAKPPQPRILKPRTIGVLIFDDFQLLDAAGPIGAFEMPMRGMKPPPYELTVIAPEAGAVRSSSGVVWMAEEFNRHNDPAVRAEFTEAIGEGCPVEWEPHLRLKERVPGSIGLIRTGEMRIYTNVVMESR